MIMKCSDIIYQPKEVKSFHIVGRSDLSSVEPYLTSLLSTYKHLYAFIDKELMMKSQIVRDLAVALQEMKCPMRAVEATEQAKTMDTVLQMCSWLMDKGADRDAVLVAVGGGITTDLVGFTAGIYKRGVRYVNIPSTLLAQVDAAIGGKTGVNFDKYKNMLGVIQQPAFTFIWPELLHTLPKRDFLSGAAEMLKTFIIEDNGNYQKAVDLFFDIQSEFHMEVMMYGKDEKTQWRELLKKHQKALTELVTAASSVKTGVVSRDPFEKGERRKLNLGHTFAHAIETLAQREALARQEALACQDTSSEALPEEGLHFPDGVTHGEAVAMGLVLAARLADRFYRNDRNEPTALEAKISNGLWDCDIPCYCPYSIEEMAETMKKDKKAEGGKVHFVLPKAIGEVEVVALTVEEVCRLMA